MIARRRTSGRADERPRGRRMLLLVSVLPLATGCVKVVEESAGSRVESLQQAERPELRDRLVQMVKVDQKVRAVPAARS